MKMTQSIRNNALVLAIFAMVTALLLATTFQGTRKAITDAERRAAQKSLLEIYPPDSHDNDVLEDTVEIPQAYLGTLGLKTSSDIHVVRKNGEVIGFIIPAVAPEGYSGDIRMLVGIDRNGTVAGVRVLSHSETPGLGDKVELRKSDWMLSFNGRSLGDPDRDDWAVRKDGGVFDQFTGATITPRAVVGRVLKTLIFYREHRDELLKAAGYSARGNQNEQQ